MINSTAFDYVNVLTKAADASYQRESYTCKQYIECGYPGLQAQGFKFEGVLSQVAWQMQASVA